MIPRDTATEHRGLPRK